MYNTDLPKRADLPTSAQLKRSTWFAALAAGTILTLVILPSEYGIDPTGAGRAMGLTQMGEIKSGLAAEAAEDAAAATAANTNSQLPLAEVTDIAKRLDRIERQLALLSTGGTNAQTEPEPAAAAEAPAEPAVEETAALTPETAAAEPAATGEVRSDELSFTLAPGEGVEVKMVMQEGEKASFAWAVDGGVVNYDTHGDGSGQNISYEKGRGVQTAEGELAAAFTGNHGWFWRNRGETDVSLTLKTEGPYSDIKRVN